MPVILSLPLLRVFAAVMAVALGLLPCIAQSAPGETVFVRGEVTVRGTDGTERALKAGDRVQPGEVLQAGSAGYAHLRFPDGGFVGLRPGTRFVVESYATDERAEGGVNVRYRLDAGSVRAITGDSIERNKSRFRLNTPVAAVGVRGTDYVVQTTERLTRASVNTGAIVLAPFGNGCEASGLGACNTSSALALAAGNNGAYIEYQAGARAPELKKSATPGLTPATPDEPAAPRRRDNVVAPSEAPAVSAVASTATADNNAARALAETAAAEIPPRIPPEVVWGRWTEVAGGAPTAAVHASQGYRGVFANPSFGLFSRQALTDMPVFGSVAFGLTGAEAELRSAGGVTPVAVTDGTLSIDFGARQFDTRLTVTAPGLDDRLNASGRVSSVGYLIGDAARSSMQVLGVLAGPQARDAGYLFERAYGDGSTLFGATTWRR